MGWILWMEQQIQDSDFVLVVCTETYRQRAERPTPDAGLGVAAESKLIRQLLYNSAGTNEKFVPILFSDDWRAVVPLRLQEYQHFRVDSEDGYLALYRLLTSQPQVERPTLGTPVSLPTQVPKLDYRNIVWNVPFARNAFFTGRADIIERIESLLSSNGSAALSQVISGLGGIGKTQTAVEYTYRFRDRYDVVIWAVAESEVTLTSSYVQVAPLLDLREASAAEPSRIVEAVKRWLETNRRWLLILDNADTPALLPRFLPSSDTGHVLITSRAQVFQVVGIANPLDLSVWSVPESVEFLFRRLGRVLSDGDEKRAAAELALELGCLPLALEQSAAFIATHQARFVDYLASFKARQLHLLSAATPVQGGYKGTVTTTWSLNFEQIQDANAGSVDVLRATAFLFPDQIPIELFRLGRTCLGEQINQTLKHIDTDPLSLDSLLEPLTRYSIIRRNVDSATFTIHRLVQEVVKASLSEADQRVWSLRVIRALNEVFPSASYDTWPLCERLLWHSVQAAELVQSLGASADDAGNLLNGVACYLRMRGDFAESERIHQQSVAVRTRDRGPTHPEVATCLNNLALVYVDQYQFEKAEPPLVRALEIVQQACGADSCELSLNLNNLGMLYVRQGQYHKARALLERALDLERKSPNREEFFEATILNNLAEMWLGLGDVATAETLCGQALEARERIGNPEKTGRSYITMGGILLRKGDLARSETFLQKAITNREQVYSAEHPELLLPLTRYAALLQTVGRAGEEASARGRIVRICERHSIPDSYSQFLA
jgi:tetratricopeptide (TPR) repeat protein